MVTFPRCVFPGLKKKNMLMLLSNLHITEAEVFKPPQRYSLRKGVFRNFAKFTGKHLCQSLLFNKVAGLSLQLSKNTSGRLLLT